MSETKLAPIIQIPIKAGSVRDVLADATAANPKDIVIYIRDAEGYWRLLIAEDMSRIEVIGALMLAVHEISTD